MAGNPNSNPISLPSSLDHRPLTLTLTLTLALALALAAADHLPPSPSPSPSPYPTPSPFFPPRTPPKQINFDATGPRVSPPGSPRHLPPPHRPRVPAAAVALPGRGLNFGQKIGLLFAGVAVAMQVVFGGFLAMKRWQLGKLEGGFGRKGAPSSAPLT